MATLNSQSLAHGLSGSIGGLIFRQLRGKTVVSKKPSRYVKQSTAQRETRSKFKQASAWAKVITGIPEKKAYYTRMAHRLGLPNAYTAAVCEYMRKGKIDKVEIAAYQGKAGGCIKVYARKKDFQPGTVGIRIVNKQGELIECGEAKRKGKDLYTYTTSSDAREHDGVVVKVSLREFGDCVSTAEVLSFANL